MFSAPMVRALLAGTKTQTRRVAKVPDPWHRMMSDPERGAGTKEAFVVACPYGGVGDRLWVKETFSPFRIHGGASDIMRADYVVLKDGAQVYTPLPGGGQRFFAPLKVWGSGAFDYIRWRPSIHMPRWASRITLEITEVRVQRLKDITDEDAKAEGVTEAGASYEREVYPIESYRRAYSALWDRINGPGSWSSNPWVWALTFRVVVP